MNTGNKIATVAFMLASLLALLGSPGALAATTKVFDEASAIEAAKRYTKAQCTAELPCTYKPRREGKQWNVWVQFTKRNAAGSQPRPYPGGHVILYFDGEGSLVRRIEGE